MAVGIAPARTAQRQSTQAMVVPAPVGGMDGRINAAQDDPNICLWAINMVPAEYGLRVRTGYREWQVGLGDEVRTIIPYNGTASASQTPDHIFVATRDGIYDVTTAGDAPVNKLMFGSVNDDSGFGTYIHYVDEAGNDLIYYADQANGLFKYDPAGDTWAQATGITPIAGSINPLNISEINYIVQHKLRLWFITKDANHAWYLPIRASIGDATEFFFAQKFRHGGSLGGLYNWTVDGGNGRDDHLVAIGRGGDVIPWTGEDPADDMTWSSTGTFFIGTVPKGNRVATEYGGELFMLSTLGIISMSDLLKGGNPLDPFRDNIGYRMSRLLRQDMELYQFTHGWSLDFITATGQLMIQTPQRNDDSYRQYVYNLSTSGWGLWRAVPMLCSETWDGKLMLGTKDGRVLRMDVPSDNVNLAGSEQTAINWFVLTTYLSMGAPGIFKRCAFIRPNFLTETPPNFEVKAYYDYLVTVPLPPGSPSAPEGDTWDSGLWDQAMWSSDQALPYFETKGASGMGRAIAVGLNGSSYNDTFLASIDVMWNAGGML